MLATNSVEYETVKQPELYGSVFDIQRFSLNDGPGIRTIVFLKGCPLQCAWCSNPESQRSTPELIYSQANCLDCGECIPVCPVGAIQPAEHGVVIDREKCTGCEVCSEVCPSQALQLSGNRMSVSQVMAEVALDRAFYEQSSGGMTISGGEPLAQPDFSLALLKGAREMGLHTAIETTGLARAETVEQVLGKADLILFDIKHLDAKQHREGTRADNAQILANARLIAHLGFPMIIRVPVIPGYNNHPDMIRAIARFGLELGLREMHLLPYHKYGMPKYIGLGRAYPLQGVDAPTEDEIETLKSIVETVGLKVQIGG